MWMKRYGQVASANVATKGTRWRSRSHGGICREKAQKSQKGNIWADALASARFASLALFCGKSFKPILRIACLIAFMLWGGVAVSWGAETALDVHWRAGSVALADGLNEVAEDELRQYLEGAVGSEAEATRAADAVAMLARAMLAQGRTEALDEYLDEHKRWLRKSLPGAIPFWRALALYEIGSIKAALHELDNFDKEFPRSLYRARAMRLQAWCRLKSGDTETALREFAEFDRQYATTVEGAQNRLEWGQALIAADKLGEAEAVLGRVGELKPDTATRARTDYWMGRLLLEDSRWAAASEILSRLVHEGLPDPDLQAETWFALARARIGLGHQQGAIDALTSGLQVAKREELILGATRRLGLLYLEMGAIDKGAAALREFVTTVPNDPRAGEAQLEVGDAYLNGGRMEDAHTAYQDYLESFTNSLGLARAYRGRGWALQGMGRFAEAATSFEKAYRLYGEGPAREECLIKAADAYFAYRQFQLAEQTYARLLTESTNTTYGPTALYQIGQCQAQSGNPVGAQATWRSVVARFPADPLAEESLLRVAQLHDAQGAFADAAIVYTTLMASFTNGVFAAEALLGRGLANYRLDRLDDALVDLQRVISRYPEKRVAEEAHYTVVLILHRLGRDEQALADSRAFLEQYPQSRFAPRVQFWLGKQAYNSGNFAEAGRVFLNFQQAYPDDPDAEQALLWAVRAAAHSEDYLRANEIITQLLREFPNGARVAEARFEQGNALAALAKFPEAILAFREIINRFPQSELAAETWQRIGDCQFMLGVEDDARYEEAGTAYRAAASQPNAPVDLVLQAEYKIGRCLQKRNRQEEAIDQYYRGVMVRYLEQRSQGTPLGEAARTWFGRAARDAAEVLEERGEWRKAASLLERAANGGAPDEAGLRARIQTIRSQHWWLFY